MNYTFIYRKELEALYTRARRLTKEKEIELFHRRKNKMDILKINDNAYIVLETKKTRNGFKHEATLVDKNKEDIKVKVSYLNRTWERFKYESVIKKLLEKINLTDLEKANILELASKTF
jgi:hypothetical protein